jgi:acyl-CoA synthetase (AMP-forming)/AMP-acid ligase II
VEQFARDPAHWFRASAEHGATLLSGPPFAFDMAARRLAKDAARTGEWPDLSRIRCVVGAEPIDARVLRRVAESLAPGGFGASGDPWVMAYGLAESACVVTAHTGLRSVRVRPANAPGDAVVEDEAGLEIVSCGRPLEGSRIRLVDADDAPVGERVAGRIEVAGRSAMQGYWRDEEASAAALHDDWIRTGDIGFLADGDLFVSGREKDVIILRGRHFFPEEIEAVAREIQGVRTGGVVAFGVVDPSGGPERVVLVLEVGKDVDFDELAQRVERRVADRLELVLDIVVAAPPRAIPRTTSGKPRRGAARKRWGEEAEDGSD